MGRIRFSPCASCGCGSRAPGCLSLCGCTGSLYSSLSWVDPLGVGTLAYNPTSGFWLGSGSTFVDQGASIDPESGSCVIAPGTIRYDYVLRCVSGVPELRLLWATLLCSGTVYLTSRGTLTSADREVAVSAEPTSCDPFDVSFALTIPGVAPYSSGSVRVYASLADAADAVCATPCPLPRRNLTLSWTKDDTSSGSATLVWDPALIRWTLDCGPDDLSATLYLSGSATRLDLSLYTGCAGLVGSCTSLAPTTGSSTCAPLSLEVEVPEACTEVYAAGYRYLVVTA